MVSPEIELYGRIIVQLIARGIIPEEMVEDMRDDFADLSEASSRPEDKAHYKEMSDRAGLLLGRASIPPFDPQAFADEQAQQARARFRVIANGGNSET